MVKQARARFEATSRLREFFEESPPRGLVSAYLYGSYGSGRAHRESDVDIALVLDRDVLPESRQRFDLRVRLTSALIHALGVNEVDVVVLNDTPSPFARQVLSDGLRILCTDEDQDRDFRRDVQLQAGDLEPFLERYRRKKLASLAR